jgi:hypothetical protein
MLHHYFFYFTFEYTIRNVEENKVGSKLTGAHMLLVCAADVYLLGNNINTVKKNAETPIDASMEVGINVNKEKTKHMLIFITRMQYIIMA